jgi:hypothetical protein
VSLNPRQKLNQLEFGWQDCYTVYFCNCFSQEDRNQMHFTQNYLFSYWQTLYSVCPVIRCAVTTWHCPFNSQKIYYNAIVSCRSLKGHVTRDNYCCHMQTVLGYKAMLSKKRSQRNCEHGLHSTLPALSLQTYLHTLYRGWKIKEIFAWKEEEVHFCLRDKCWVFVFCITNL